MKSFKFGRLDPSRAARAYTPRTLIDRDERPGAWGVFIDPDFDRDLGFGETDDELITRATIDGAIGLADLVGDKR